jgi:hypothetical protein
MSEELDKLLHAAPAGIQVLTTCSAGQNALEVRQSRYRNSEQGKDPQDFAGSLFLNSLRYAYDKGKLPSDKTANPDEDFPVDRWVAETKPLLAAVVGDNKIAQVPKLTGSTGEMVKYVADAKPAAKFELPPTPKGAEVKDVRDAFAILHVPPLRGSDKSSQEPLENVVFFPADALADYKMDMTREQAIEAKDKYPVRAATAKALNFLQKLGDAKFNIRDTFSGEVNTKVKEEIKKEQTPIANLTDDIDDIIDEMKVAEKLLDKEDSKFWKATFLYTYAQLNYRWAFFREANLALGAINTDSLPEQKAGSKGLQLVPVAKMQSKKDVRDVADKAKEMFDTIIKEHKGTPWEIVSKQAKTISLGLKWQSLAAEGGDGEKMEMKAP